MKLRAQTYGQALGSAGAQQAIIFLLAVAILDGGVCFQVCIFAAAAFWIGVALLWFRRGSAPTKLDLLFIEAAFVPLCLVAFFVSYWIWNRRGVL